MPELPEVERAAGIMRDIAQDRIIERVEVTEDSLVYSGITHEDFVKAITGRKVTSVGRYGKVFYLILDGNGPMPVLHLGMTGMLQVKGQDPFYYQTKPKGEQTWPPRFVKFIFHISECPSSAATQVAFCDARRLGRIRLCASPLTEPPISTLGFDPILSMPSLKDFSQLVRKRTCAIKALLLDQSFSAGVGNWVADEILHQARVHPEQRANSLADVQLALLHEKTVEVCQKAVEVNADSTRFPDNWLFKHRWGKGKKVKPTMLLPSGEPATIKWIKVGGRTSAYVPELQELPKATSLHENVVSQSDLSSLSDEETNTLATPIKRKSREVEEDMKHVEIRSSKRTRSYTKSSQAKKVATVKSR